MAKKRSAKAEKVVKLKLTDEQKAKLAKVFGEAFVKRVQTIRIDKIEGYALADLKVN